MRPDYANDPKGSTRLNINTIVFCSASLLIILICLSSGGCSGNLEDSLWKQIDTLTEENDSLNMQVNQLKTDNQRLREQVNSLSSIDKTIRLEAINTLEKIKISRRSGLFNKNGKAGKEKLIVNVQPIDVRGDIVKMPGKMSIELWNLNSQVDKKLLGNWQISSEELSGKWSNTLLTNYYRLSFDVADILTGSEKDLAVKAIFTDYFTGRIFKDQKNID